MTEEKKLSPILQNSGFQNIAHAIRQGTVNAQRAKINGNRLYDVRYGLGKDLIRKANYNTEFIQTLTEFMHSYNQENLQMQETRKDLTYHRRQITTEDIEAVVALVDEYDAKTIANMLVAFGYARVPREEGEAKVETA